jgi:biotin carboxyl carrier protein
MTEVALVPGAETALDSRDRLVVSPAYGKVSTQVPMSFTADGEVVRAGDVLARLDADGQTIDVHAPCDAWVMAYLVRDGERLEPGCAIAHLRAL